MFHDSYLILKCYSDGDVSNGTRLNGDSNKDSRLIREGSFFGLAKHSDSNLIGT